MTTRTAMTITTRTGTRRSTRTVYVTDATDALSAQVWLSAAGRDDEDYIGSFDATTGRVWPRGGITVKCQWRAAGTVVTAYRARIIHAVLRQLRPAIAA